MRDEYNIFYPAKYAIVWVTAGSLFGYFCLDFLWFHQIPGANRSATNSVICSIFLLFSVFVVIASVKNLLFPTPIIQAGPDGIRMFGQDYKKGKLVPWNQIMSISACRIFMKRSTDTGIRIACNDSMELPCYIDGQTEFTSPDNNEYLLPCGFLSDTPERVAAHLNSMKRRYTID